jgi:hypothetical protein
MSAMDIEYPELEVHELEARDWRDVEETGHLIIDAL